MKKPDEAPAATFQDALDALDHATDDHVRRAKKKVDSLRGVRPVERKSTQISIPDPFPPPTRIPA